MAGRLGGSSGNPYFAFTDACNGPGPAALMLASGQACVWYRLALASKDGDWILREDERAIASVLAQLGRLGARYRLGCPLALPWLRAGWSSHFEATDAQGGRLRFDFVSRPPRLGAADLARCWGLVDAGAPPVLPRRELIAIKRTMRLKDYAFVGALATQLEDPADRLRCSLDAGQVMELLEGHPDLAVRLASLRPVLAGLPREAEAYQEAIDGEIRRQRREDERRMAAYAAAMHDWSGRFRSLGLDRLPLPEAHAGVCTAALGCLPQEAPWP